MGSLPSGEPERAVRLVAQGRVQGVGFRYFTHDVATELKLRGWVRNRRDGSVEVQVAGPESAVAELIARLRRGPPGAAVSRLTEEPVDGVGFSHFEIVY